MSSDRLATKTHFHHPNRVIHYDVIPIPSHDIPPSLLQPLFITSPLLRPTFSCPSTSSPITPSSPAIGVQPLMFPKLPVSSTASTDSEAHSSDWGFESCTGRSPSLLTCLFQSQSTSKSQPQSRQSSSSCSASPRTPVLPEPILRRDTVSDDSGKLFSHEAGEIGHDAPTHMNRKKSCLKFTVAPCPPHSGPSPKSSYTATIRSTPRHSSWREEEEYQPQLTVLESESDDEGYEEDEEGGFTSDEDDTGTFMTAKSLSGSSVHPSGLEPLAGAKSDCRSRLSSRTIASSVPGTTDQHRRHETLRRAMYPPLQSATTTNHPFAPASTPCCPLTVC